METKEEYRAEGCLHNRLRALQDQFSAEYQRKIQILQWADQELARLDLVELLPEAVHIAVGTVWDEEHYATTLYFYADKKADLMPIITASQVEKWQRQNLIGHNEIEGRWAERLYTDFDHYDDGHRLTLRFVSSVKEGDVVEGCTVKRIKRQGSALAIACESGL